ncbi:MAG: TIGR00153 family protein [Simkaniaceae bacterium]|nr:TIGR00153 family protein [Simkaniaceae bacterium]
MRTIAKLFGKSPFSPMQGHMKKVGSCVKKLSEMFKELEKDKSEKLESLMKEEWKLEYEADLTRNDIRNHLPKSLFLPIERSHLLEILSIQHQIADQCVEIGSLLVIRKLTGFEKFGPQLLEHYENNIDTFWNTRDIIKEFDELLESSFGGLEAEKVKEMVEKTSHLKYEADKFRHQFQREFYADGDSYSPPIFHLWIQLIDHIGHLSTISERLANRIRMILELK